MSELLSSLAHFHTSAFPSFLVEQIWERIISVATLVSNYPREFQFPVMNLATKVTREKSAFLMVQLTSFIIALLLSTHSPEKPLMTNEFEEFLPILVIYHS